MKIIKLLTLTLCFNFFVSCDNADTDTGTDTDTAPNASLNKANELPIDYGKLYYDSVKTDDVDGVRNFLDSTSNQVDDLIFRSLHLANDWSLLHAAIYNDSFNIIKLLVEEYNADVNVVSRAHATPLDIAYLGWDAEEKIIDYLTAQGAKESNAVCVLGDCLPLSLDHILR